MLACDIYRYRTVFQHPVGHILKATDVACVVEKYCAYFIVSYINYIRNLYTKHVLSITQKGKLLIPQESQLIKHVFPSLCCNNKMWETLNADLYIRCHPWPLSDLLVFIRSNPIWLHHFAVVMVTHRFHKRDISETFCLY